MHAINKPLVHPVDFDNAMFFGSKVSVWKAGILVDVGGYVDGHDHSAVMVNGEYYLKSDYEFRVRKLTFRAER